jgi:RimJ/RimL family protein N-acetyltransferase
MTLAQLTSARLAFRQASAADAPILTALLTDPLMVANEGTWGDAAWFISEFGPWTWLARRTDDDMPVGFVTLEVRGNMGHLGYGVIAEARGQGFAREMARRVVRHGFDDLGLQYVIAQCTKENVPSVRVLRGVGMRLTQPPKSAVNNAGRTEDFYIMSAAEYAARA